MTTPRTAEVIGWVIDRQFQGRKRLFARHCGIDPADVSRVSIEARPATLVFVGKAMNALNRNSGALLLQAYLTDVISAVAGCGWKVASPTLMARARGGRKWIL